jgi:hypothetical protein
VRSDDGLKDHLTLVRDRQTVLRGQLTELLMGEAHDYRMRMIIKRRGAVSTEIFPVTSKRSGGKQSVAQVIECRACRQPPGAYTSRLRRTCGREGSIMRMTAEFVKANA